MACFNTPVAGIWYWSTSSAQPAQRSYLSQVETNSKTKILASTSRTTLTQTFYNSSSDGTVFEAQYDFPLYDGVTVVSFKCTIGKRVIHGIVKEKQQARTEYQEAVNQGRSAGLFEQSSQAADVFTTKIGNIPRDENAIVEIVYLGELKHDAESDGTRFTIPSHIAPRYGYQSHDAYQRMVSCGLVQQKGVNIIVDIVVETGSSIRSIQSPSHPISICIGRTSSQSANTFQQNLASATLAITNSTSLDKDFIIVINAQGQDGPRALLETHPDGTRALMTTLVPKFNLKSIAPEIVFVCDRSGSMDGEIPMVKQALRVFLKSLPLNAKFNICSFGSRCSFLFPSSKPYDATTLNEALAHVDTFAANYGGTELLRPIQMTVEGRLRGVPLEVMVLTDGQIWNQQQLFDYINEESKNDMRVFTLGIGAAGSSALVEGMARAGRGFSQSVSEGETIDKRVVRMLKAALTPHISDYSLSIQYAADNRHDDDDFEIIQFPSISDASTVHDKPVDTPAPISLYQQDFRESPPNTSSDRYDHLPAIRMPDVIQTPSEIPSLFAFSRTTIYMFLGPNAPKQHIKSVKLCGTCPQGPVELEIPVENVGEGQTIHQLAAKKVVQEVEEGRGWIASAKTAHGVLLQEQHEGDWERIVEREAVRISTKYQVGGKFCSFVAVEDTGDEGSRKIIDTDVVLPRGAGQDCNTKYMQWSVPRRSQGAFGGFGSGGALFGASTAQAMMSSAPAPPAPYGGPSLGSNSSFAKPAAGSSWFASTKAAFGLSAAAVSPVPPPLSAPSGSLFGSGSAPSMRKRKAKLTAIKCIVPSDRSDRNFLADQICKVDVSTSKSEDNGIENKLLRDLENGVNRSAPGSVFNEPDMTNATLEQRMHEVIKLLEFDGSWKKVDQLLKAIGVPRKQYENELTHLTDDAVKATAIALAWLQTKVHASKDIWDLLADKARNWLADQNGIDDAESVVEMATSAFFNDSKS